jgi:hypothetical protein
VAATNKNEPINRREKRSKKRPPAMMHLRVFGKPR